REAYLLERVHRAEIAALTVLTATDGTIGPDLAAELLDRTGVMNIVLTEDGTRQMILSSPQLEPIDATFDLRDPPAWALITDAMVRIVSNDNKIIRIQAYAPADMGRFLEITLPSGPLTSALRAYGVNILILSFVIAIIAAVMVFFAMRRFVVRPITEVIANVKDFSENPEDASRIIKPASRVGEISRAEHAVAEMEREVHAALKSKARLASLGEAVAKISHDLRNILSTTQLMADRLEMSQDPVVARAAPKIISSLDRAIRLCQSTLTFGRAEEAPPESRMIVLAELAGEVCEGLGLPDAGVQTIVSVDQETIVEADPEHLYRVLNNLVRNAAEAIRASGKSGEVNIAAVGREDHLVISVADTGPGLPTNTLEKLFKPFQGTTRVGGSGLGLAIAHELVHANGGALTLAHSTTSGTEFHISIPTKAAIAAA
ncbi:MAG: sensor histidine kinase, partial [Paracoccaceae bacterium]